MPDETKAFPLRLLTVLSTVLRDAHNITLNSAGRYVLDVAGWYAASRRYVVAIAMLEHRRFEHQWHPPLGAIVAGLKRRRIRHS